MIIELLLLVYVDVIASRMTGFLTNVIGLELHVLRGCRTNKFERED